MEYIGHRDVNPDAAAVIAVRSFSRGGGAAFEEKWLLHMIRKRSLRFLLCLCILAAASASAHAATISATSCSQPDVAAAVASAARGDTVTIPSGSCTWTSPVVISKGMILQGAGQDFTVITASNSNFFLINGDGTAFRLTSMGFTGSGGIFIDGRFSSFRMDHVKFINVSGEAVTVGFYTWPKGLPAIYPLLDHITYTSNVCVPFMKQFGSASSWTAPDSWGTVSALYLEDSTITYNVAALDSNCDALDMEQGAQAVIRHNTFTNAMLLPHDTGSTPQARGMRIREIYANTFVCSGVVDCGNQAIAFRGGSTIAYDNKIPLCQGSCTSAPSGWESATWTQIQRLTDVGGGPWTTLCNSTQAKVCSDFRSHCSGGTHPACGTDESPGQACAINTCGGAASCGICQSTPSVDADCGSGNTALPYIDGNSTAGGYACRDQTGRGRDSADHLSQAVTPVYWWNNIDSNTGNQITTIRVADINNGYIQANQDYYTFTTSFSGASGVGRGVLSARPSICTPMVGYYATDTATFYRCSSPNTWTQYYAAFTYPHPLQAGATPPLPPPALRVTTVH